MFDLFRWFRDPALRNIFERLTKMSTQSDAISTKLDTLQNAVTDIRKDILDIKNGLPESGGLSPAEVAALSTKLDAVVADAQALDAENPAANPTPANPTTNNQNPNPNPASFSRNTQR